MCHNSHPHINPEHNIFYRGELCAWLMHSAGLIKSRKYHPVIQNEVRDERRPI
jgi:hypothetical protein